MEGINWLDLFTATDRFLAAIVERNVMLVYVVLFSIFFSETGLVFMAFLPGDSLLFVAGAVSALPAVEYKGLNVHLLVVIIALQIVIDAYAWQHPKNLWNDGDGVAAACARGGVPVCRYLPSFTGRYR
jgi:hypothetical protein